MKDLFLANVMSIHARSKGLSDRKLRTDKHTNLFSAGYVWMQRHAYTYDLSHGMQT